MVEEGVVEVCYPKGHTAGARRIVGLTQAQTAGEACLVCGEPGASQDAGWIGDVVVRVHPGHHDDYRLGIFTAPGVRRL